MLLSSDSRMTHVYQKTTDSLNAGEDNPAEDTAGGIRAAEDILEEGTAEEGTAEGNPAEGNQVSEDIPEEDSQAAAGIPEEDTAEDNQAAGGIHDYESIQAAEDIQAAGAEEAL